MKPKWIILISSVIIVSAAFLYLKFRSSTDFEPLIKQKLQQLVKEGSDSLYTLDIDHIEVDVVKAEVTVINASLNLDSVRLVQLDKEKRAPNDVYKITLKHLVIEGIGPDDLLKK